MSLRAQVLQGGRHLLAREVIGIVIRTLGVLTLVRLIGPTDYGLFAGPLFVIIVLVVVATSGLDSYLIRRAGELAEREYHQVFTYMLVSSTVIVLVGGALAQVAGSALGETAAVLPFQVMLLSIPLNILWNPARAKLERDFSYRRLATGEVSADVMQYVVALSLAVAGAGVWAPVLGYLARQAVMLVVCTVAAGYRPRLHWDGGLVREMLGFGVPLSTAIMARRAADLVVPIVVGRYEGAAGVGIVALGMRLTETASFLSRAMDRLAMVAFGRVQRDLRRLRGIIEESTSVQTLAIGLLLSVFSCATAFVLPALLGEQWREVSALVPLLAANYLLMATLTSHNTALIVLGRRLSVVTANVSALVLLIVGAFLLVPRLGLAGFALAQILSQAGMYPKSREVHRLTGASYRRSAPWLLATMPLVLLPVLPVYGQILAVLCPVLVLCSGRARRELRRLITASLRSRRREMAEAPVSAGGAGQRPSADA